MLRGELVGLRARLESDVPILDVEMHDDVPTAVRGGRGPWRPYAPGSDASFFRVKEPEDDSVKLLRRHTGRR